MYQDEGKDIAGLLQEEGRLGRIHYLNAHIATEQNQKTSETIRVEDETLPVTHYGAEFDHVEILEAKNYV